MSEPRASTLRLRRVRFKDGRGNVEVFRSPDPIHDRKIAEAWISECLDAHASNRIAGFALVVWAPDSASTAMMRVNDASQIPSIMVPDFVRNRLLAERIERWTRDGLKDDGIL